MKIRLLFFVMMIVVGGAFAQRSYHFDVDGTGTRAEGTGWDDAIGVTDTIKHIFENDLAAGDTVFSKPGTYTFTANLGNTTQDGTATAPIIFIGVKAATTNAAGTITTDDYVGHWSTDSTNFPHFELGTAYWRLSDYFYIEGWKVSGSGTNVIWGDGYTSNLINCVINSSSVSGTNSAVYVLLNLLESHIYTAGARGVRDARSVRYCKIVGGSKGISAMTSGNIIANEFYDIDTAILVGAANNVIDQNTFMGCSVAVFSSASDRASGYNNIIEGSTVGGVMWGTQTNSNIWRGNHGDDTRNTDMWSNVAETGLFRDRHVTTGDPKFVDPPGDLNLQSDSPCKDAGIGIQ